MLLLILPLLITSDYLYTGQDLQWIAYSFLFAAMLLIQMRKPGRLRFGVLELILTILAIWSLIRTNPQLENAPNSIAVGLFFLSLIMLHQWTQSRKFVLCVLFVVSLGWNLAYFAFSSGNLFYLWGPFNQENHYQMANYAVCILFWVYSRKLHIDHRRIASLALIVLGLVSLVSSVLTGAKLVQMGWVIFLGFSGMRLLLGKRRIRINIHKALFWSTTIVLLTFIGTFILLTLLPPIHGFSESFSSRQTMNTASLTLLKSHGLWGVGFGEYRSEIITYWPSFQNAEYEFLNYPAGAHNFVVHYWCELGVIGLILLILYFSIPLAIAFRVWLYTPKQQIAYLFPFLLGWYLIIAGDYPSQGFVSAILVTVWIPLLLSKYAHTPLIIVKNRSILRIILILFCFLNVWNGYQQIQQARGVHFLGNVGLSQQIVRDDFQKFQESLYIRPNSVAYFYGSWLFLQMGDVTTAKLFVNKLTEISRFRWPVQQRLAQILIQEGFCKEANAEAQKVLRLRSPGSLPFFEEQIRRCKEGVSGKLYIGGNE